MFFFKFGKNWEIWEIIYFVVLEEMFYMMIVLNILIVLGGDFDFIYEKFVFDYFCVLLMNVGCEEDEKGKKYCLEVGLSGFIKQQVYDVFMVIEQFESLLKYDVKEVKLEVMLRGLD